MNYFLTLSLVLLIYITLWFVVSLIKKRNDVADVAWGLGFVLLAWVSIMISNNFEIRTIIVTFLVTVWGLRLAYHIHSRHRKTDEDYRYLKFRQSWGKWFYLRSYLQVYLLQGFLLLLVVTPVLIINNFSGDGFLIWDVVGVLLWATGFFFETVGDAQLANFIKNPANKGKLIMTGLWKYSRHPNYFGEVLLWWGVWLLAISVPYGLWGVIGPLTITFLILKVSGIPMLEEKMEKHPDFAEYKRKVNVFFPGPTKK